jgi:hypothetical protein
LQGNCRHCWHNFTAESLKPYDGKYHLGRGTLSYIKKETMISSAIRDSLVTVAAGYCAALFQISTLKVQNIVLPLIIIVLSTGCAASRIGRSGQEKINGKTYVVVGASSGFGPWHRRGAWEVSGECSGCGEEN